MHDIKLHDILPQPPVPTSVLISLQVTDLPQPMDTDSGALSITVSKPRILDTPLNQFYILHRYHAERIPSHDPDAQMDLTMLSNIHWNFTGKFNGPVFNPYPNESSFLLGEWYWNQGNQKSQKGFKNLIDILANPNFSIADVEATNWPQVNTELGINDRDKAGWLDEDAGWQNHQ
jgi:hypothetical protein